jgi:hypothetical protein
VIYKIRAWRRWVLVAVAMLGVAAHAHADADAVADADVDAQQVRSLLHEFMAGATRNDAAVHERFWDEDLVYTSSDGTRFGKPELMSDPGDPAGPDDPQYTAEHVDVRLHGELAVITFRLVASRDGQVVQEYFNTGVLRRRDGEWRAITWQATRIGDPAPE